ncbi:MAG: 8-amino-7-oxononanoate synthase [Cyanobacteria bacterium J06635_15]
MMDSYGWIERSLATLHKAHWYRSVQAIDSKPGPEIWLNGDRLVNFASNDYLGLASDPRLAKAAIAAIEQYGTSSTGSRLLSGHRPLHGQLEQAISAWKQTADALVFSSGYAANLGTVSALMGQKDLILSDEYNHSSLKKGAVLSGARVVDYDHCDLSDLQAKLVASRDRARRALIVTDSVFSMDGDLCPLPSILEIAERFDCMVMVDEAHGTGVLGKNGAGGVEALGCTGRPLIQMGTLSKALGSLGGYVTGAKPLIEFLRNRAPTWIYTTGLSPADTAAALAAIVLVQQEPERRQHLQAHQRYLTQQIDRLFPPDTASPMQRLPSASPIICLQVKDAATVLELGQKLRQAGVFVSAVRPPTTPTSRLRITLMATHTPAHLDKLIAALKQAVD